MADVDLPVAESAYATLLDARHKPRTAAADLLRPLRTKTQKEAGRPHEIEIAQAEAWLAICALSKSLDTEPETDPENLVTSDQPHGRVAKYSDVDQEASSMLSGMQYPHWLMVAGAALVVLGAVGFAFRQPGHKSGNGDEWEEVDDEDQAPTRVKHRQGD
jgi:hypothetical protein